MQEQREVQSEIIDIMASTSDEWLFPGVDRGRAYPWAYTDQTCGFHPTGRSCI